jgi:hypothetical protein
MLDDDCADERSLNTKGIEPGKFLNFCGCEALIYSAAISKRHRQGLMADTTYGNDQ